MTYYGACALGCCHVVMYDISCSMYHVSCIMYDVSCMLFILDTESRITYWRRLALGTIIFTLVLASCLLYFIWRVSGQKRRLLTQAQQRNESDATTISLISDTAAHPDSAMASSALNGRNGHRYDQSMDPEEVVTDDDQLLR